MDNMTYGLNYWINTAEQYKAERDQLQAEAVEREAVIERLKTDLWQISNTEHYPDSKIALDRVIEVATNAGTNSPPGFGARVLEVAKQAISWASPGDDKQDRQNVVFLAQSIKALTPSDIKMLGVE